MFPREHGAYGQLVLPLVTSFAVAGITRWSVLVAAAVVAGFLAHEPLLVLLGRRGQRARREKRGYAATWLAFTTTVAIAAGVTVFWSVPLSLRWSLVVPLLPATMLLAAIVLGREKEPEGEVAAGLVFSLAGVPLCLTAGASAQTGLAVASAFAAVFVSATLAVRVIVLEVRRGGDRHAARDMRVAVLTSSIAAALGLFMMTAQVMVPWIALAAAFPGLAVAMVLAMSPPHPSRLRAVGWTLVATSSVTALILIAGLTGTA